MWLWIISNIAGALLGAATVSWFGKTKAGKWCETKYLDICWWANDKYGIDILNKEEVSLQNKFPNLTARIVKLESRLDKIEGEARVVAAINQKIDGPAKENSDG